MTAFPYSIDEAADVKTAAAMMEDHNIRHLPVTQRGELMGVVSDSDLRVALCLREESGASTSMPVGMLCGNDPYVVDLDAPVDAVVLEMAGRQIGCVIVLRGEKIAGIFTTTDACRMLGNLLRETFPPAGDDQVA